MPQIAQAVGECILRCGGSDALFPNDFGKDLLWNGDDASDVIAFNDWWCWWFKWNVLSVNVYQSLQHMHYDVVTMTS